MTHDTPSARRDHDAGWKHAFQVRAHFLALNQDRMTRTVSEIVKDYELKGEMVPIPAPMILRIPSNVASANASHMPHVPGNHVMMRPPPRMPMMMNPMVGGMPMMMRPPTAMMPPQMGPGMMAFRPNPQSSGMHMRPPLPIQYGNPYQRPPPPPNFTGSGIPHPPPPSFRKQGP